MAKAIRETCKLHIRLVLICASKQIPSDIISLTVKIGLNI